MKKKTITVCDKCKRSSCWQGEYVCDDHKTAGTLQMTVEELLELDLEHPNYWEIELYREDRT
jgi:hypothetical protein